jgi:Ser-tRNA(Ala) deacylase AlaX
MKKQFDPHMHTAEHILNQVMVRLFGTGRCFSAHIERKKSKCDYHFDRPLTPEEENRIVEAVNAVIRKDLPVTEDFTTLEKAAQAFDLSRLPADSGDKIRIIRIGTYDRCPCIGPHVSSTAEIGAFRVTSTRFEKGVLRIRFKLKRPA